jgi:hypothetical protein
MATASSMNYNFFQSFYDKLFINWMWLMKDDYHTSSNFQQSKMKLATSIASTGTQVSSGLNTKVKLERELWGDKKA